MDEDERIEKKEGEGRLRDGKQPTLGEEANSFSASFTLGTKNRND